MLNKQAIAKMQLLDLEKKVDSMESFICEDKNQYNISAKSYCELVSTYFAQIYNVPFIPHSEEATEDKERVLKICKVRYPELEDDYILEILSTVCWLSNR